jgi:hypothetical protein
MPNSIWLEFADGQYLAHLTNKRIDEIETKTGSNLGDIYSRTMSGIYRDTENELVIQPFEAKFSNREIVEVIRQGFIGGGKAVVDGVEKKIETFHVNHLINSYLEDQPRVEAWKIAAAILHSTMEGYESPGEVEGGEAPPSPTASSGRTDTPDT